MDVRSLFKTRFLLFSTLVFLTFGILGFIYSYHLPKMKSWMLLEIEKQSQLHSPVRVWPQDVEIQFLPLGISLKEIKLLPQKKWKASLAPATIKEVSAYISIFALFKGELRASLISLKGADLMYFDKGVKKTKAETPPRKATELEWTKLLAKIPVDSIEISETSVVAKSDQQQTAFKAENLKLRIENRFQALKVLIEAPSLQFKIEDQAKPMEVSLLAKTLVEKSGIQISALKVQSDSNFVVASGSVDGDTEKLDLEKVQLSARAFINLSQFQKVIKTYLPEQKLPRLVGSAGMESKVQYSFGSKKAEGSVSLETKEVGIGKYRVGNTRLKGKFEDQSLLVSRLEVMNPDIRAKVENLKFENSENQPFSFTATVKNIDFQKFMQMTLGLKKIPVRASLKGRLPCSGQLKPAPILNCDGMVTSEGTHVYSEKEKGKPEKTIVKVPYLHAKGKVSVDTDKVTFKADLEGGEKSKGSANGTVSFEKGFNINYKADRLEMSDIENLADLKLEGSAVLSGFTKGTTDWGVFEMDLRAKKLWFENYGLGQLNSKVKYKSGKLIFQKAKGQYLTSRYEGNVTVDFDKEKLFVVAKIPFLDLADLKSLLKRKYELPVDVGGTGSGLARVWGPLNPSELSYDVDSSFFRGEVAGESFDELIFNVKSRDGFMKTNQVSVKKAESQIKLNGKMDPDAKMDAVIVAKNFRLEQLAFVETIGLDVSGQLDATMSLKGKLPEPQMILIGRLRKVLISDTPTADSSFEIEFLPDRLKGKGRLLGRTVSTKFSIPYSEKDGFDLDLETKELNFTSLFDLVSSTAAKKDFKSKLSSKISLHSKAGGFWASSGDIDISEFELKQGSQQLVSEKPIHIVFKKGVINSEDFYLSGPNSFLKVNIKNASKKSFTSEIDAKLNLNLISILTPFLSNLRGRLSMALKTSGPVNDISLIGSSFIDKGFVKLQDFPHAFEDLSADILFNQRDILINALKATLGEGAMRGQGKVVLQSMETVPVAIKGEIENVNLNIPEGVKTRGTGRISFTGNKFPYKLAGNYDVSQGEVTMEFTSADTGNANEIQPSQFLPKSVTKESFQPITMDLKINTLKPLKVKNSLVEAEAEGKLHVKGTPADMKLKGLIKPKPGGTFKFKDTEFVFSDAFVEYKNDPPANPTIYLSADARVQETTLNANQRQVITNYDVHLLAQGRSPDFKVKMDSQPPLSEDQIFSLLALGVTTATSAVNDRFQEDSSQDAVATGVIGTSIGAQLIGNQLSEPLKERLGIEMNISTSVNADDNASYPKVILSKQWTPNWQFSASRTIEKNPKSDVRSEYNLNDNLSFILLWEGRETALDNQFLQQEQIGADIEYRQSFK